MLHCIDFLSCFSSILYYTTRLQFFFFNVQNNFPSARIHVLEEVKKTKEKGEFNLKLVPLNDYERAIGL